MRLFLTLAVCFTTCQVVPASTIKIRILRNGTPGLLFEGETVNISCTVTNARRAPDIKWLQDVSTTITSTENHPITTKIDGTNATSILTIRRVTSEYKDSVLTCEDQTNTLSSSTKKLKIGKIRVSKSSHDFAKYGEHVRLTCSITEGNAEDVGYLQWREFSSKKILKTSNNTASLELHLKTVNETNAGIYECVCNTRSGFSFFLNEKIEIKVSPANIGQKQKEVSFKIGEMMNFTCDIRGYPLNILWKKNCSSTSPESEIEVKHTLEDGNRTLVINELNDKTQGKYCCIGWNNGGREIQIFILKRVASASTIKIRILRNGTPGLVFEGETVNISCTVTNAEKVPDINWLKDVSTPITSTENHPIKTEINGTSATSILTLRQVTSEYKGSFFTCKDDANNLASNVTKKLKIGKIRVSKSSHDFAKYGEEVKLTCSITEGNAGDVGYLQWREFSSKRILTTSNNTASLELQLKTVNETNAGIYECVCNTRSGFSFFLKEKIEIKVSPTNIGQKQKEVSFKIGQMMNFTCDIRGYPLNILWKKSCNSRSPESEVQVKHTLKNSNRTFIINEANDKAQGKYCCIGWNNGGRANQTFILKRDTSNGISLKGGLNGVMLLVVLSHVFL